MATADPTHRHDEFHRGLVPTDQLGTGADGSGTHVLRDDGTWGALPTVLNNYSATAAPTVNDDSGDGYSVGSHWVDTTNLALYVCLDASPGAAKWIVVARLDSLLTPYSVTWTTDTYDGIFNAIGTQGGVQTFANPTDGSGNRRIGTDRTIVTVSQSSSIDASRTAEKATDHSIDQNVGCSHTGNVANSWWKVDFGSGHTFTPTRLGIQGRNGGGQEPRNFKLQGSNDNSSWTDLLTVSGAGPNDSAWYSSAVTGASAYRYLRIFETGTNSSGANYLVLGEVEMWGTLS